MNSTSTWQFSLAALVLAGCSVQAPYVRPQVVTPPRWQGTEALENTQPGWPSRDWWQSFNDDTLNQLEQAALANNYDLEAALHRISQARATARIAEGDLYPSVDAKLQGERKSDISGAEHTNAFKMELSALYDLDLWGRLRNLRRAAQADTLAASEFSANLTLVVAADVARTYFQLAALDQRIDLAHQTIETAQRIDALVEARYHAGAVSELDQALAKTSLANIQAALPPLEQARQETLHALAILLGRNPADLAVQPPPLTQLSLPATLPVGLPSELLQRRPDIRQAEANLMAAHADIGAARASLFPSIQLTGQGGYASDQLSSLIRNSNSTLILGASLLAPIFHGGSLRANVDRSKERYTELLQLYHQSILGALRDVEDALVAVQKLTAQESLLQEAEQQARRAFELAEIRYRSGATDAITMLNAQNTWLTLQNSVLQIRFARMNAHVSLYKAVGGGGRG